MTKRRIVEKTYSGMERYVVQYKILWFWIENPCFHVGNDFVDKYDDWGYYDLKGAQKCLERCNSLDYIGQRVI